MSKRAARVRRRGTKVYYWRGGRWLLDRCFMNVASASEYLALLKRKERP